MADDGTMDVDAPVTAQGDEAHTRRIRITNHGKIQTWVSQSLAFLKDAGESETRTIVLHTMPAQATPSSESESKSKGGGSRGLDNATATVPRLVTVAEIIKREYLELLKVSRSARLVGLYQYNEISILDSCAGPEEPAEKEKRRSEAIIDAMNGKSFPRQKQTPYMQVTLSTRALALASHGRITEQAPLVRTLTKSAKKRVKKQIAVERKKTMITSA